MPSVVFITSGTTWTVPPDCGGVANGSGEFIDTIGGGASGAAAQTAGVVTGGAAGACSRITSLFLSPGASVTMQVGAAGAVVSRSSSGQTAGNPGTDTWFNGGSLGASSVGAKGGAAGAAAVNGALAGALGGASGSGVGTTKSSGGNAGSTVGASSDRDATGGGGAAGPGLAGNNGADTANNAVDTASIGGAAGTAYDGTHRPGAGGNGASTPAATGVSGSIYGAGGGAAFGASGTVTSGAGAQGLIIVSYIPLERVMDRRERGAPAGSVALTSGTATGVLCHKAVLNITGGGSTVSIRTKDGLIIPAFGALPAGLYTFDVQFDAMLFGTPANVSGAGFYHT